MSNMIERIARAMAAEDSGPEFGEGYMKLARVVIAAMREPSESYMNQYPPYSLESGWYPPNEVRKEIW